MESSLTFVGFVPHSESRHIKMASEEQIERKKKLEFKTLQLKVSEKLSRENLKDLCHLLMGEIPKTRLEEVTEGIDLFAALEERGKLHSLAELYLTVTVGLIKMDDVSFLKDLLETIERIDLCEMIREYEERGNIHKHYSIMCLSMFFPTPSLYGARKGLVGDLGIIMMKLYHYVIKSKPLPNPVAT